MNTRIYENYIELMDPKRPYGDMTYFFNDMAAGLVARLLGIVRDIRISQLKR